MNDLKTLIIGSSGTVGSELSRILRSRGLNVRETTSRRNNTKIGSEERVFLDVLSGEGLRDAFVGIDQAFLISPPGFADQYKILSPLIQESKRRGLRKVVLMTAMGANSVETSPFRRAELELERSGIDFNIIRPNWFFQNFNTFWRNGIKEEGVMALPAGTANVSFVDSRDIAAVAAELLTSDKFANKDFDLSGPSAMNHADVAQLISTAIGRKVEYRNIEPRILHEGLVAAGLPPDYVDFMIMIFGFLREGYNARITGSVEQITGRLPRRIEEYIGDHLASWQ